MQLNRDFRSTSLLLLSGSLAACSPTASDSTGNDAQTNAAATQHTKGQKANLANFDDLDFRVYSGQKWDEFSKSHAIDTLVHYPNGSTTTGLAPHLDKLKSQFTFAPDTKISKHPIKLADGNMTALQGVMEGTFSKPMNIGNGRVIKPTGKMFKLSMMTVGRLKNGVMKEEWLFWDNAAFMQRIGVGQ
jgi:SnoaL-like polyketide cyclase